ncbi:unnamed protein product [Closterium sp. Naga37s-1]|nr:unnamed protein product [Closterium sp. Naga37s-1]
MESLPPDVVYTVLRLAQPAGLQIARLACVSTGFARMAKEHLWRWHCRDQLAFDASPSDAQRSDSETVPDAADANAVDDKAAANRVSGEDPNFSRQLLDRMLRSMENEETLSLAKLVNVCPGVRPALQRGRVYKAMNCGCSDRSECACWEPLASPEGYSSAPHSHGLSKFEIMAVNRTGAPTGHLYGLRRLGHDDLAASSSGVAEVEVQIGVAATHERMEGNHSDHGSEDDEEVEEDREVLDEVLERVVEGVVQGVMGVLQEEEAADIAEPGTPTSGAEAAARTVPAAAAGPAATHEHVQAVVVEPAAPTSGATSAAAADSASPLTATAAPHGQIHSLGCGVSCPYTSPPAPPASPCTFHPAKDGSAAAPLSTMVDALSLNAHAAAPPCSASSAPASNATAPEE